jgi:hypothetical protein
MHVDCPVGHLCAEDISAQAVAELAAQVLADNKRGVHP